MQSPTAPAAFWSVWLAAESVAVMLFGLVLVVAPGLARNSFALLLYGSSGHIATFGVQAVAYISLLHAVLGAVMFGWGIALFLIARGPFARGERLGWRVVAASVLAWFVPDSAFSVWSGFWPNAVLNLLFFFVFALPLPATYRVFYAARA
ncbi:MAG: hypothetical protein H3C59_12825 [Burkholderiaceae bacterium]|nr:hypothetical protein [Burkholderiaceae bacterium]